MNSNTLVKIGLARGNLQQSCELEQIQKYIGRASPQHMWGLHDGTLSNEQEYNYIWFRTLSILARRDCVVLLLIWYLGYLLSLCLGCSFTAWNISAKIGPDVLISFVMFHLLLLWLRLPELQRTCNNTSVSKVIQQHPFSTNEQVVRTLACKVCFKSNLWTHMLGRLFINEVWHTTNIVCKHRFLNTIISKGRSAINCGTPRTP